MSVLDSLSRRSTIVQPISGLALSSPDHLPISPRTSGERERSAAAADASDLVGIGVCVTD